MEKIYPVGKAAELTGMTAETLRHYDRIGLVHPSVTDEWTGYRYYGEQEIVRLRTVRALRSMEIPLKEIKKLLALTDLEQIAAFLRGAAERADKKIAELYEAKARIERAQKFYEEKLRGEKERAGALKTFPERVLLLSETLRSPTVETLWDYHRHFYAQVGQEKRNAFAFEDLAGVYEEKGQARMFAVCKRYVPIKNLLKLPAGNYLCAECTEETLPGALAALQEEARRAYSARPPFTLRTVVLTGILQWKYELQLFVGTPQHLAQPQKEQGADAQRQKTRGAHRDDK